MSTQNLYEYLAVLVIPLLGLIAILRGGKWNWKVVDNSVLNYCFWFGWFGTLVIWALKVFLDATGFLDT